MEKQIQTQVIRSSRKTLSMRITGPDAVEIRAPKTVSQAQIDDFIREHRAWLDKHMQIVNQREEEAAKLPPLTGQELLALSDKALMYIPQRARYFSSLLHVTYGRIAIRSQKSKWGSCSSQGNLSFNCLLMLCPQEVADYVIVHELCHRIEMNHSPRFWAEVEKLDPNYRAHRQWLKTEGSKLIARMEHARRE
ncbi:MAG: M48 family metallopeptidase [Clostridia bacterium]|nr:M48 family metallopeptidase [Clostridia bacterium]